MKLTKAVCVLCSALLLSGAVFAQEAAPQTTVEEEYLSSVEDVIIAELANSDDRDNKFVALQYIEEALAGGRMSSDIQVTLEALAGEGVLSQTRENGRLMNNYPDVRTKACELLGQVKTEESKEILKKIALADNEPMVVTTAIRSLGDVGINENDEITDIIVWTQKKYATLNPTSSLAYEILVAYEKLADTVVNRSPVIQSVTSIASNYRYAVPVRTKAYDLLKKLTGVSNSKNTQTSGSDNSKTPSSEK